MTSSGTTPEVSRRERKRLETHDQIRTAALHLFNERGFADVTVADLCERASVAQSTFFRHFATKEDVVFDQVVERFTELPLAMAAQPVHVTPREFIIGTFEIFMAGRRPLDLLADESQIVLATPALLDRFHRTLFDLETPIGAELSRRFDLPADAVEVQLLAAQFVIGLRVSIQVWSEHGAEDDVVDVGAQVMRGWVALAETLLSSRQPV